MVKARRRQIDRRKYRLGLVLDRLPNELLLSSVRRRYNWATRRKGLGLREFSVGGVLSDEGHWHVELLSSLIHGLVVILISSL